jgi:PAS domain S-box-containing protein
MYEEPDIVKMLRGKEKLGTLQSSLPSPSEKFEVQEKSSEDAPYESDDFAEDAVKTNTMDKDVCSSIVKKEKIAAALEESEERYKALFNSSFELVYLHDFKGNFIDANPVTFKLLGYNKEELGSLNFSSLLDKSQFWKAIKTIKEIKKYGRQKEPTEYRLKTKNGTFVDIETTAEMVYRNGKPYAIQGIARDITERKSAEEKLVTNEKKYRQLVETLQEGIWAIDKDANTTFVNPRMAEMLGYTVEEMQGKHLFSFMDEHGVVLAKQKLEQRQQGIMEQHEFEFIKKDGTRIYALLETSPLTDENDNYAGALAGVLDITKRKNTEEALREGEEKWTSLTRNTNDIIMMVDSKGIIQYINKTLPPYTPKETIGKTLYNYVPKDHHYIMSNSLTKVFKTGEPDNYEVSSNIPEIGTMWFSTKVVPIKHDGEVTDVILISTDITERKRVEERLRETEERFRIAAETSNDIVYEWDMQHSIQWFGKIDEMLGYCPGEFPRTFDAWTDLVHPEDKKRVATAVQAYLDGRMPYAIEYRVLTKDGACRWWTARGAVARTSDGHPIRWIGTVTDITERKKAEEELNESEEKFRDLFENANDLIQSADANGRFIYVNKKWLRTLGYTEDELKGLTITDILRKDQIPHCMEIIKEVYSGKSFERVETVFVSKDGREIYVEGSANAKFKDGKFIATRSIFRDITEHKKAEEHIKKQNEFVETVINSLQYSLYVIDKDYNIVLSNEAAKERGIVDGGRCHQFTHHSQEPCSGEHICPLKEVFRTGKSIVTEHIHFDNDGNSCNFDVHGDPIFDKDGQVIQMIEYSIDTTERKQAQEKLKEKIDELERYKKVTVDREMKMMDLKKRIIELEEKSMKR